MIYYNINMPHAPSPEASHRHWLDMSAMGLSGLCLVHCLATGVFLALLSSLQIGSIWLSERFHLGVFCIAFVVALFAFRRGWQRRRLLGPLFLGGLGLGLMGLALLPTMSQHNETILTVLGALLLASGHGMNMWSQRALA